MISSALNAMCNNCIYPIIFISPLNTSTSHENICPWQSPSIPLTCPLNRTRNQPTQPTSGVRWLDSSVVVNIRNVHNLIKGCEKDISFVEISSCRFPCRTYSHRPSSLDTPFSFRLKQFSSSNNHLTVNTIQHQHSASDISSPISLPLFKKPLHSLSVCFCVWSFSFLLTITDQLPIHPKTCQLFWCTKFAKNYTTH